MAEEFLVGDSLAQAEAQLGAKIIQTEKFPNKYGTSGSLYRLSTDEREYLLKAYQGTGKQGQEYAGYLAFRDRLPTPELRGRMQVADTEVLFFDFYPSVMVCDMVTETEIDGGSFDTILGIESRKNTALRGIYESTPGVTTFEDYLETPVNRLFAKKLFGSVYDEYYEEGRPISPLLQARINLNGHQFSRSGYEVLDDIKAKLRDIDPNAEADCVLGHGDLHHMNILYGAEGEKVIDFEYHSSIPVGMELSKPYYIDYVGTMFFFFQEHLAKHFDFGNVELADGAVNLDIRLREAFKGRIDLTKDKVAKFGDLISKGRDFLSFNDYLVLCHTLSHNPNNYTPEAQLLFAAMLPILAEFDYREPETLFDLFR